MTDVVDLSDNEKEEQVRLRDRLVNDVMVPVSNWAINNASALRTLSHYRTDRAIVEVAIGYLIQERIIEEVIRPGTFTTHPLSLTYEHLLPKL